MPFLRLLSAAEQAAAHLRAELLRGGWSEGMPGVNRLAADLGINHKTAEAALRLLEREGLLAGQGPGRQRRILPHPGRATVRPVRVAILVGESSDQLISYIVELQHLLVEAGHRVIFPERTLTELGMDERRLATLVRKTAADAWVVYAGARGVLEWFANRPEPVFALFGQHTRLPMAATAPNKLLAFAVATRQLIGLGHRRIAMLCRALRRHPQPGRSERIFLDELAAHGLPTGPFNLPDWEETTEGLQKLLNELFRVTPPTALIVDEAPFFAATQQFLAGRGLRVPRDVSLVCTDPDPTFEWCVPSIAHIRWDSRPVVRRIVRWAAQVSRGQRDVRQTLTAAEFVPGGTVGPAPPHPVGLTQTDQPGR